MEALSTVKNRPYLWGGGKPSLFHIPVDKMGITVDNLCEMWKIVDNLGKNPKNPNQHHPHIWGYRYSDTNM
jgi:hypothetical protein